jgi:hypothetical protein
VKLTLPRSLFEGFSSVESVDVVIDYSTVSVSVWGVRGEEQAFSHVCKRRDEVVVSEQVSDGEVP